MLVVSLAGVLVLLLVAAGTLFAVTENLGNNITRVANVFTPLSPAARPQDSGQLTFLLVGRDSGVPDAADVLMLASATADRTGGSVVAIPGSSVVDVPGNPQGPISAVGDLGGPSLQVETVEQLTGVRVDHYATLDFGAVAAPIDEIGGIELQTAEGTTRLDGAATEAYVREAGQSAGDVERAQRQQAVLRAMMQQVVARGPGGSSDIYDLLVATGDAVTVDDTMTNNDLRWLALDLRGLRPAQSAFLTAPIVGGAEQGAVSLDEAKGATLWDAVRTDAVDEYAAQNPADVLSTTGS